MSELEKRLEERFGVLPDNPCLVVSMTPTNRNGLIPCKSNELKALLGISRKQSLAGQLAVPRIFKVDGWATPPRIRTNSKFEVDSVKFSHDRG